jgi:MFS family permease
VTAHSALSIGTSVLMKPILAEFGWDRTAWAASMTTRMLAMIAVVTWAGQLTDRLGARRVLAAGGFLMGAGVLGMTLIGSWSQLVAVSLVLGAGQACIGSVAASALVLRLFRRRRGVAIGILNGGDNLLNSAVPPAAAAGLAAWGWRPTLAIFAAAYLLLAVAILNVLGDRDVGPEAVRRRVSLRDLPWRDARLWMLVLAYVCTYAWITSIQIHFHAFQTDLGKSPADAASLLSIQILVGALGAPLFGWLAERGGARAALLVVLGGLAATSVMTWTVTSYEAFATWAVIHGLVNSGVVALLALVVHELFESTQIGRLMGVAFVFCMAATMAGNQFSAWIFDTTGSYLPAWLLYRRRHVRT